MNAEMTSQCGWAWVQIALEHELGRKADECAETLAGLPTIGEGRRNGYGHPIEDDRPPRERIGNAIEKAKIAAQHYDEVAATLAWAKAERALVFEAEVAAHNRQAEADECEAES